MTSTRNSRRDSRTAPPAYSVRPRSYHQSIQRGSGPRRRGGVLVACILIAIAGIALAPFARDLSPGGRSEPEGGVRGAASAPTGLHLPRESDPPRPETAGGAVGLEDGVLANPASPFADLPAITRLEPNLRTAVQQAAQGAAADGIQLVVTSGWRSADYQRQLLDEAIADYGTLEEARRFVAEPETSAHVTGHAVDIGATDGAYWLAQHGSDYGLCQTYANEIWHFELATSPGGQCPPMLPDASHERRGN